MEDKTTGGNGTARLETYTDGVFAIAATLLVLDLSVDTLQGIKSSAELWQSLMEMLPRLTSFFISFVLVSMLWIYHVRQFRLIDRVDSSLLWINAARLMFLVLIPFSTGVAADYPDFTAGRIILPINIFFAILLGYLTWVWAAAKKGHLLQRGLDEQVVREQYLGGFGAVVAGAITISLSWWIGAYAFLAYFLEKPLVKGLDSIFKTKRAPAP